MTKLQIEKDRLILDGKEFYLAAGDVQYFRMPRSEWKRRLALMREFGLTAVQTYCPWNLHEPREGVFDFAGLLDLAHFLTLCAEVGLKVLLRPSPYICGEWDFGGLPWWLLRDRRMHYRCAYKPFLDKVDAYYKRLCREFVPFLSTNGGPIIAVGIENEYGTVGSDVTYLRHLIDSLAACGVDVPFYQTDCTNSGITFTKPAGTWMATNYRIESETAIPALRKIQPDKPAFVGEYWSGRAVYWGEDGTGREIAPIAKAYRTALDLGAYVSFYMFAGGTNFGFMNGARIIKPFSGEGETIYRAISTSYNCDALLGEDGNPTEKYYACRKELDEHLGRLVRDDRIPAIETQAFTCVLTETAPVFDNLDVLGEAVDSTLPLTFEELNCPYGFVLYSTTIPGDYDAELTLSINQVRDYAVVFIDGERCGIVHRDHEHAPIKVKTDVPHRLDILVENLGRINTGAQMYEEKGILGEVKIASTSVYGFTCHPFTRLSPIDGDPFHIDLSALKFGTEDSSQPRFLRGKFTAKAGVATHLLIEGMGRGFAMINGFNVGRYRDVGPQKTLYIPGELLNDGENELILFEMTDTPIEEVNFIETAVLAGKHISE